MVVPKIPLRQHLTYPVALPTFFRPQVRHRDGEWLDAKPLPGAVLVNAGQILQVTQLSNSIRIHIIYIRKIYTVPT